MEIRRSGDPGSGDPDIWAWGSGDLGSGMISGDLKDLEIHDGIGSATKTIWRSVDLEIWKSGVWRSDDMGVHQGTGSDTRKIWRSGVWRSTKGLAPPPMRSGDMEIWRSIKGLAPTPGRSGDL